MSIKRGDKAFNREQEKILAFIFKIIQDITIEFQGKSYNIIDNKGNIVEELSEGHRRVSRDILISY